jgi:hypothetical protein
MTLIYFVVAYLLHGFAEYFCSVKAISILLCSYIFSLAVYPCSDSNTCQDEAKAGIELSQADDHEHSDEEQDACSPFCICQCCSTHAQQPAYFNLPATTPLFTNQVNTYVPKKIQALPHTFWQPPKVS